MIIVFKPKAKDEDLKRVVDKVERLGLTAHVSKGEETTIVGLVRKYLHKLKPKD